MRNLQVTNPLPILACILTAVLCLPQLAPCQWIWAKPLIGHDKAKTGLSIKSKFLQETLFTTVVHKTRRHCLSRLQLHSVYQEASYKETVAQRILQKFLQSTPECDPPQITPNVHRATSLPLHSPTRIMSAAKDSMSLGGYECRFTDPPPDELLCLICSCVAREPQQMDCCGKIYCKTCLQEHKEHSDTCPECRQQGTGFTDSRSEFLSLAQPLTASSTTSSQSLICM